MSPESIAIYSNTVALISGNPILLALTVLELSSKSDKLSDIRPDNEIDFKLSPILQNNNILTSRKFHANQLNIKKVSPAGYPAGYSD